MSSGWEHVGRLKKELQAEKASRETEQQQLAQLQTEVEELKTALYDERKGRTSEQQQIKELIAELGRLKADVERGEDRLLDAEQKEKALKELQGEAKLLRAAAADANMWRARVAALEAKDKALPRVTPLKPPPGDRAFSGDGARSGADAKDANATVIGKGDGDADDAPGAEPVTVEMLQERVRELEQQLARAERSAVALQDAASRATSKLQMQAVRQRELEAQLLTRGDALSRATRAAKCAARLVLACLRCMRNRCSRPGFENGTQDQEENMGLTL